LSPTSSPRRDRSGGRSLTADTLPLPPGQVGNRLELAEAASDLDVWDRDVTTDAMRHSERAKAILRITAGGPVTLEQLRAAPHLRTRP
jgi:hypothetical protein